MMDRPLDPNDLVSPDIVAHLREHGAHIVYDVALPSSVPKGDPKTAAERIEDCDDRQWSVWWLLSFYGPMTGDEIAERYETITGCSARVSHTGPGSFGRLLPPQTVESQRSRRKELERAGHIEPLIDPETGKQVRRDTRNGGTGGVWVARSDSSTLAGAA